MKPWLVNPAKLIIAARKLARHLEDPQSGATKWSPPMRSFYETVIRYEKSLYQGGPKKKTKP